ncbi:hypothetical protein [Halobacterium noricense]|nr:hypothetical protein [Halobacterium noricense]UHH25586.1 hypothetical protein LT974_01265 [Halobacterium noricense]
MLLTARTISQSSGVAFALDRDADYDLRNAVHVVAGIVEDSEYERTAVES